MSCAGVEGLIAGWCWQGGGGDVCLFTDVLCDTGVEGLKLATRQYARRQLKWIRNRFLKRKSTCRCEIRTQCFRELFSYCVTSWCRITVSLHPSHAVLISQSCCVLFWCSQSCCVLFSWYSLSCCVMFWGDTYSKCKCNACFKQAVMLCHAIRMHSVAQFPVFRTVMLFPVFRTVMLF